ncbi:MAG: hypothetical protein MPJ50_02760 [Pirellulales bacterium]|nr:hypothetical protein [Pirellulales bacterium]
MRKILDAFLGSVKDGIQPREVALAVALGVIAGFVTGWNLTLVCVLLTVVLLRVPFQMFGQAWAVSAMAAWMLTPATFHTGRYVLEQSPLAAMFASHADSLSMVLFDFDRYTLTGGLVWGMILAIPAAWLTLAFARSLQSRLRKVGEAIKKARFSIRAVCWLTFGNLDGVTNPPKDRWIFRPFGAVLCLVTVVPMAIMAWMYGPGMMEQSILHTLSLANQAEVSADSFDLSLTDGTLHVRNLQIADAGELDHDRMRVASLTAVLKPAPLLRGRVHIEKILIDGITCDVPRETPARAYHVDLPDFDLDPHVHFDGSLEELGYKLENYARNWIEIKDRMDQAQDVIERVDALVHRDDKPQTAEMEIPAEYLALRSMRSNFGSPRPSIHVELIRAKHLAPQWGLGDQAMMEVTNLNSEPELLARPTRIEFAVPDHSIECIAHLNYHGETPHHLHLKVSNISMAEVIHWDRLPQMAVSGGTLTFHGDGTFDHNGLELPMTVRMEHLAMALPGGSRQLGLPAELWNQGLAQLGGLQVNAKLHGAWESPRVDVDTKGLVTQFQHQLHAAGHAMLATAVDEQVRRGQEWVQDQTSAQLARGQEYIDQGRDTAEATIQSGRDAVDDLAGNVQSTLDQANGVINQAQNQLNNTLQDTVDRALGGLNKQEDLANQFLQNHLNRGNDRYGNSPAADIAKGLLSGATGNVRQGLNHVGTNMGHVVDVAGNAASDAVSQAEGANLSAQNTAHSGLDVGQNVVDNADQTGRYGAQGLADQANQYADQLGGAANSAMQQLAPPKTDNEATTDANVTGDRYADYYANRYDQQKETTQADSSTVEQQGDAVASQLAGGQQNRTSTREPAALLYPESMRSARQLQPPAMTAQTGRYSGTVDASQVTHTGDNTSAAGTGDRYVDRRYRTTPDRYSNTHQRPQSQTSQENTTPQRSNPPGAEYYNRSNGADTNAAAANTGAANSAATAGQSRYGAVQDYMQEVGQRSAANTPASGQNATETAVRYPEAGINQQATQAMPPMASASSVASDAATTDPRRMAPTTATQPHATQPNAASIPPVGFERGYVPQDPFTPEEYQALLLMQQQHESGMTAPQEGQPQGSSWRRLADSVTGGAKKLWPFSRSAEAQGTAAQGDGTPASPGQYPGQGYAGNYTQPSQQQPYTANVGQPAVQQAEPQQPWYRRLFRR